MPNALRKKDMWQVEGIRAAEPPYEGYLDVHGRVVKGNFQSSCQQMSCVHEPLQHAFSDRQDAP